MPNAWSPDGKVLAISMPDPESGQDIWVFEEEAETDLRPLVRTRFDEWSARFSPDGKWLAYVSNESGQGEVYVQAFPGPGGKYQVSTDGGAEPVWSHDGRELFYRNGEKMMTVPFSTEARVTFGRPVVLFEGKFLAAVDENPEYDVSPDGQWFVMVQADDQGSVPNRLHVVLNWFEELKRKAPIGK